MAVESKDLRLSVVTRECLSAQAYTHVKRLWVLNTLDDILDIAVAYIKAFGTSLVMFKWFSNVFDKMF